MRRRRRVVVVVAGPGNVRVRRAGWWGKEGKPRAQSEFDRPAMVRSLVTPLKVKLPAAIWCHL